ncbi:MAG TPA: hypothetical protein VGS16_01485, partial [Candidatus Dormibacteraeota bacterium]|nr:hypothetical protein [Candidatus Dormibacteraeota bacterium]
HISQMCGRTLWRRGSVPASRTRDMVQSSDGLYKVDGLLDPVSGAAFKTAAESFAKRAWTR